MRGAPTHLGPLDGGSNQGSGTHSTTPKNLSKSLSLNDNPNAGGMKGGSKFFLDPRDAKNNMGSNANIRKSFNAVSGMSSGLLSSNGSDDGWTNLNTSLDEVSLPSPPTCPYIIILTTHLYIVTLTHFKPSLPHLNQLTCIKPLSPL